MINLVASQEAVKSRLLSRGRQDDNEEAIIARFREYEQQIKPILKRFRESGVAVYDINAEQTIEQVHTEILKSLSKSSK